MLELCTILGSYATMFEMEFRMITLVKLINGSYDLKLFENKSVTANIPKTQKMLFVVYLRESIQILIVFLKSEINLVEEFHKQFFVYDFIVLQHGDLFCFIVCLFSFCLIIFMRNIRLKQKFITNVFISKFHVTNICYLWTQFLKNIYHQQQKIADFNNSFSNLSNSWKD